MLTRPKKNHKEALQAIKLILLITTKTEFLTIIKSNLFSILYYNADVWLLPLLKKQIKTKLLSVSAAPLKLCCFGYDQTISYEKLHDIVKYPTPNQITKYNHAIFLYKTFNDPEESKDWLDLFFNQNFKNTYTKGNFWEHTQKL